MSTIASPVFPSTSTRSRRAVLPALVACGLALGAGALTPRAAHAQRFNPATAGNSLGTFPSMAGNYSFNTTGENVVSGMYHGAPIYTLLPVMTDPSGNKAYGVFKNGCALFTFDSVSIGSSQHLYGYGSRPLVLISRSSFLLSKGGTISVNGGSGYGVPSYLSYYSTYSAPGGVGGAGGGAGGNGQSHTSGSTTYTYPTNGSGPGGSSGSYGGGYASGGGGFGGAGGNAYGSGATGGAAYGVALSTTLQGGSGAGGSAYAGGGGGGGALEISAATSIYINGTGNSSNPAVSAVGGDGSSGRLLDDGDEDGDNPGSAAGGGSGGAIYLAAPSNYCSGWGTDVFSVRGGYNALVQSSYGGASGGGGGGRMRVEYNGATYSSTTTNPWTTGNFGGQSGDFVIAPLSTPVQ